jgi:hypothetical protein
MNDRARTQSDARHKHQEVGTAVFGLQGERAEAIFQKPYEQSRYVVENK